MRPFTLVDICLLREFYECGGRFDVDEAGAPVAVAGNRRLRLQRPINLHHAHDFFGGTRMSSAEAYSICRALRKAAAGVLALRIERDGWIIPPSAEEA